MSGEGFVIWFTGIAGSGKSTVAKKVEEILRKKGLKVENLDADEVRANLSPDLGYTEKDRDINTKRLAFMGQVLARNGVVAIITAVSNLRRFRERARKMIDRFIEVYVKCPVEICKERDPQGLYRRAEQGEITDIAGLHIPYEDPPNPEVAVETDKETPEKSAEKIIRKLEKLGYLEKRG